MTRSYKESDRDEVMALWLKYNQNDVFLPLLDFTNEFVKFKQVLVNREGRIVGFTCINLLPELIMVHDKSVDGVTKHRMFTEFLSVNKLWAKRNNQIQLYAFLDGNAGWIKHAMSVGFKLFERGIYYLNIGK